MDGEDGKGNMERGSAAYKSRPIGARKASDEDEATNETCSIKQAIDTLPKKIESGNEVLREIKVQTERKEDIYYS